MRNGGCLAILFSHLFHWNLAMRVRGIDLYYVFHRSLFCVIDVCLQLSVCVSLSRCPPQAFSPRDQGVCHLRLPITLRQYYK